RLSMLQALVIELGLAFVAPSFPATISAARELITSKVFLHVGDYLEARKYGPAAVQTVMHNSKSALIKDLKRNSNYIPRRWVKEVGLQVLLVRCY
ncbi:hypothetical protein B0H19DRAFT_930240, partial [Mycena capillaripes]